MGETQISIRINRALWRQFRAACVLRNTAPTHEIARFVAQQVEMWYREEKTGLATLAQEDSK